jgi:hypothetical protein
VNRFEHALAVLLLDVGLRLLIESSSDSVIRPITVAFGPFTSSSMYPQRLILRGARSGSDPISSEYSVSVPSWRRSVIASPTLLFLIQKTSSGRTRAFIV